MKITSSHIEIDLLGVLPPFVILLISVLFGLYPAIVPAETVTKYFVARRRFLITAVDD